MVEPAGPIKSFFKSFQKYTIVYLCFALVILISGILLNLIQAVLYWSLRYVNKRLFRKINYYFLYSFFCQIAFLVEWWADTEVIIYVDREEFNTKYGKEHALVILNHSFDIDGTVTLPLGDYLEVLGNGKIIAKKSFQYIPPLGLSWKFGEGVFLERSFDNDKKIIYDQVQELGDYPDPIWLMMFPEGTRLSPSKLEASQRFAKEHGLPLLKHHLLPRTKGFVTCLQAMRDKINVIYSIQLAYPKEAESPPSMMTLLAGKALQAHLYIRRIHVEEIPHDEEGITQWLYDHYETKDRMQESFYNTGSFFEESGVEPLAPFVVPRRIYPVINTVFWAVVIFIPLFSYLWIWLITGQFTYFIATSCFLGMSYVMVKKWISTTEISKSSSYGVTKKD